KRSRDDSGYAAYYRVYRDTGAGFRFRGETTVSSYTDVDVPTGTIRYRVFAYDLQNNKSPQGNIVTVTLSATAGASPEPVETLSGKLNSDGTITLTWERSRVGSDYADFYRIYHVDKGYWGDLTGFSYAGKTSTTTFKHKSPLNGKNSYYVTAVNSNGGKSSLGNVVTVTK
ncbi:MAG: hypothetical protein WD873_03325, partial [Candidatus Hydrogenedentales bacterium]